MCPVYREFVWFWQEGRVDWGGRGLKKGMSVQNDGFKMAGVGG